MDTPTGGYYRELLPENLKQIRLAMAHSQIIGCEIRKDLTQTLQRHFENHSDKFGKHYANGLATGQMIPVIPLNAPKVWANNGELFFKS